MTGLLAQLAPYVVHSSGFGVLLLALALAGLRSGLAALVLVALVLVAPA